MFKINELSNLSEYLVLNNLVNFVLATLLPSLVMLVVGVLVIRGIKSIMRNLKQKLNHRNPVFSTFSISIVNPIKIS